MNGEPHDVDVAVPAERDVEPVDGEPHNVDVAASADSVEMISRSSLPRVMSEVWKAVPLLTLSLSLQASIQPHPFLSLFINASF